MDEYHEIVINGADFHSPLFAGVEAIQKLAKNSCGSAYLD